MRFDKEGTGSGKRRDRREEIEEIEIEENYG
jgi:hypothetical protein